MIRLHFVGMTGFLSCLNADTFPQTNLDPAVVIELENAEESDNSQSSSNFK